MAEDFDSVAAAIAAESQRAFAAWDPDLFQRCSGDLQHYYRWQFKDDPQQLLLWRAFLQLAAEGIGRGYLRDTGEHLYHAFAGQNLLGWCLVRLLPGPLKALPRGERLPALAKLWNLLEGLLGEPEWVQRYALSRAAELETLDDLEVLLYDVLDSAYAPAEPATWAGAATVTCLDTREAHDAFLPGEMYLAAPRVLCVADRRAPEAHTAIFLERGAPRLMGPTGRLPPHESNTDAPAIRLNPRRLHINDAAVDLPQIARPYAHAVSPGGFVVVSAIDSQRLWVIESP